MKRYMFGCLAVLVLPFVLTIICLLVVFVGADANNVGCAERSHRDVSLTGVTLSAGASNTDPFTKGTKANQNAEKLVRSWIDVGLSGAAANGLAGWINSEGGFAMFGRAEGHYGDDLERNSIAYGNKPVGLSYYTTEAGGGTYQITPFTKYAPLGDPKWEDIDEMNKWVMNQVKNGDWVASMDLTGGNHSFEQFAQMTDVKQASLVWQAYERGSVVHINQQQKQDDAQKFYDLFEGGNYSYDEAKFKANFGATSIDSGEIASSSDSSESLSHSGCGRSSSSGGEEWGDDGVGIVSYKNFNAWKADELPNDLKPYALDPKSLGLHYRSKEGWNVIAWSGGQCTDLSASLMYALWEKDGKPPIQKRGNGKDVVSNWVSIFGGKADTKPSAGAVFSSIAGSGGSGDAGHTGVVSHVFENGDYLIVEQNFASYSGEDGGFGAYTWNYRYVTADSYGYTFYSPSQAGYSIVDNVKTVGEKV